MKATKTIGIPCVMDDNLVMWYFLKDTERLPLLDDDGTWVEGCYMCNSLEDGIDWLIQTGYITEQK